MIQLVRAALFLATICHISSSVMTRSVREERPNSRHRRMIRGRDANIDSWRFITYLNFHQPKPKYKVCGGALIAHSWVLTAAHCVDDLYMNPHFVTVAVGRPIRSSAENHARTYNVSRIIVHAKFLELISSPNETSEDYFNWDYDIALIQLNTSSSEQVDVVDLPSSLYNVSEVGKIKCKAAGWGSKHELKESKNKDSFIYTVADALQEIDVPIKTKAYCKKFHGKEVSNLIFCGGDNRNGSMTSCLGDSGSPLVCNDGSSKKPFLAGIVIGGDYLCRTGDQFNMFTEIAKYRKWIDNVLIHNILLY